MLISEIEAQLKALREKHGDLPVYVPNGHDDEHGYFEAQSSRYADLINFDCDEDEDEESNIKCAVIDFR